MKMNDFGPNRLVSLDGLSKVGKGTACAKIAEAVEGTNVIDSGLLYRAFGIGAENLGIALADIDDDRAQFVAEQITVGGIVSHATIEASLSDSEVLSLLKSKRGDLQSSKYSPDPAVRRQLRLAANRLILQNSDVLTIYDGRAGYKELVADDMLGGLALAIFAHATLDSKVAREVERQGGDLSSVEVQDIRDKIELRDESDRNHGDYSCQPENDVFDMELNDPTAVSNVFESRSSVVRAAFEAISKRRQILIDTTYLEPDMYAKLIVPMILIGSHAD